MQTAPPQKAESAGAVISVDAEVSRQLPAIMRGGDARRIFIVKLANEKDLLVKDVIRVDTCLRDRCYFLEAAPGTYAVVAISITTTTQTSTATHAYFLRENSVRLATFTVAPGKLTVIGGLYFEVVRGLDGADAVQKHYAELLAPGSTKPREGAIDKLFTFHHRAGVTAINRDEKNMAQLLKDAREDLTPSGWAKHLP